MLSKYYYLFRSSDPFKLVSKTYSMKIVEVSFFRSQIFVIVTLEFREYSILSRTGSSVFLECTLFPSLSDAQNGDDRIGNITD